MPQSKAHRVYFDSPEQITIQKFYSVAGRYLTIETRDRVTTDIVDKLIGGYRISATSAQLPYKTHCHLKIRCEMPPDTPSGPPTVETELGALYAFEIFSYLKIEGSAIVTHAGAPPIIEIWLNEIIHKETQRISPANIIASGLKTALRYCGLYELHAAGVVEPETGAGALIIGDGGTGKTTLTLRLALSGWRILSDDLLILHRENQNVIARGLRRFFLVDGNTLAACRLNQGEHSFDDSGFDDSKKSRLELDDLFPNSYAKSCQPRALFFSSITNAAESRITNLTPAEAMSYLLNICPWAIYDPIVARGYLQVISELIKQSRSYLLHAGLDILDDGGRAAALLTQFVRKSDDTVLNSTTPKRRRIVTNHHRVD